MAVSRCGSRGHHLFILRHATSSVCRSLKIDFINHAVEFDIDIANFRNVRKRAHKEQFNHGVRRVA